MNPLRPALAIACFAVPAAWSATPAAAPARETKPALADNVDVPSLAGRIARQVALAEKKLDLAKGEAFYLLLDPERGRLDLMLKGTVLRHFPVSRIEVGYPEVVFVTRRPEHEWQGQIFAAGELDPPRLIDRYVYEAPPPTKEGAEPPVRVPPTPEEAYPVPARYHVRFDGGISLEIRAVENDPEVGFWKRIGARIGHWWHDARAAGTGDAKDTIRLRLTLTPDDAASLFRALPPQTKLLVLPRED